MAFALFLLSIVMKKLMFKRGEVIVAEGERGTVVYTISSGRVEVSQLVDGKKVVVETLNENMIFGEMGLIEDKPRSATVTALEDTVVLSVGREEFREKYKKDKTALLPIVKALFDRLRRIAGIMTENIDITSLIPGGNSGAGDESFEDDGRYLVLTGANSITKRVLDFEEIEINTFPFNIGGKAAKMKDVGCDIRGNRLTIKEKGPVFYISSDHLVIMKNEGRFMVAGRGADTPVFVNGQRLSGAHTLVSDINELQVGREGSPFVFNIGTKKMKY